MLFRNRYENRGTRGRAEAGLQARHDGSRPHAPFACSSPLGSGADHRWPGASTDRDAFAALGGVERHMQIARDEPALFVKLLAARLPRETETSGRAIMIGAQPGGRWGMSRLATSITFPNIRERIRRRARPPKVALRAYIVLTRGKWDFAGCAVSLCFYWCPGAESNHRHEDFQSSALPTELPGRSAH